ncbi:PSD1 and planctomycete cytochrome C domain-containing protein [Paludisphaera mucosa]|uniref:PSD1 and planctomycete cytochrome C domain-containing protein n=1 Tax=Paludisphaera mucosa TaxID=3030827 RepID=A0ABT6FGN6_9BACT|nr:PSD1 and planctomycete cytochrome C domain-containing protein [Paludisphaera mucosa]MDG3006707.1 PSD1 and planctomycete cytochrome C domain-containing protein [Paludisphaera mucosa]
MTMHDASRDRLRRPSRTTVAALAMLISPLVANGEEPAAGAKPTADAVAFFETSIRPVLVESCQKCHGPEKQKADFRVDSREAILKGGSLGPAVVPGKPAESPMVQALAHAGDEGLKMPPAGKLSEPAIQALTRWVEMGAPWGDAAAGPSASAADPARDHWAFQPLKPAPAPDVHDRAWVRSSLDARILARLEQEGMTPSPAVDRRTLLRRASLDLLGVPPTLDEIRVFEADPSPDAFAKVVDRLLASPLYGERWGRHWLDVARYADTKGYVFQEERKYPYAFTYRDYVIDAFNADVPFDRFVVEQLAADQLPADGDTKRLAAMGFLTVGRRFLQDKNEIIDDRIDLVGRGLLGLTVACARCHDHKFDPIPTEDYYSLYGVFASSIEPAELPRLDGGSAAESADVQDLEKQLAEARKARDDYKAARRAEVVDDLQARGSLYLKAAYDVGFDPRATGADDRAKRDGLASLRLRLAARLWKARVDVPAADADPVLAPWKLFQALPKDEFTAQAPETFAKLDERNQAKPGSVHPLVLAALREAKPTSMEQVAAGYAALLAGVEERLRAAGDKKGQPLAEPEWESLRQALHAPGGPLIPGPGEDRGLIDRAQRAELQKLENKIAEVDKASAGRIRRAMVMNDAPQPTDPHVFVRGNPGRPGKPVPRQFLKVLSGPERQPFAKGSGRLELAQAIVGRAAPLAARVIVNRVWRWHLGEGLVDSPSDFGVRADPPSHPDLLDDLAAGFVADGWSIKGLHRRIMLSSVYQQSSVLRPDCLVKDARNRLVWRFNRQRLDFEALRDSILAVCGSLDPARGGPSVAFDGSSNPPRRTVYGFIDRQNMDGVYRAFDFAIPDATNPRRFVTTVPQQALFLMNSPFVQDQARRLAAEVATADQAAAVRSVYERVLGRGPDEREAALALAFVGRPAAANEPTAPPLAQLAQVLMLTNEFLFVD